MFSGCSPRILATRLSHLAAHLSVFLGRSNLALPPAAAAGVGEAAANAEIYVVGIPASCSTEAPKGADGWGRDP